MIFRDLPEELKAKNHQFSHFHECCYQFNHSGMCLHAVKGAQKWRVEMTDELKDFDPSKTVVAFDYVKAPGFQSLRADGVIGGITPTERIHIAFYSERPAIPRRMSYELDENGGLGKIVDIQSRNSIVREMSADVFLDLRAAETIYEWLGDQISALKEKKHNDEN